MCSGMLDLVGGERVLEIGCGWGGLAERMLEQNNCTLTGVTLSSEQLAFAQRRLFERDLSRNATSACKTIET